MVRLRQIFLVLPSTIHHVRCYVSFFSSIRNSHDAMCTAHHSRHNSVKLLESCTSPSSFT